MNRRRLIIIAVALSSVAVRAQDAQGSQEAPPPPVYRPLSGVQQDVGFSGFSGWSPGMLSSSFHVSQIFDSAVCLVCELPIFTGSNSTGHTGFRSSQAVGGGFNFSTRSHHSDLQLRYSGGDVFSDNNFKANASGKTRSRNRSFHDVSASDSYTLRRFSVQLTDSFNYSPDQSRLGGGIAGIGGLGSGVGGLGFGNPGLPGLALVQLGTASYSNATSLQTDYQLSKRSTITAAGVYGISRLPDFSSFDSNQIAFSGGFDYRLTGRTSLAFNYNHAQFRYIHLPIRIKTDSGTVTLSHALTRSLKVKAAFGPQEISETGIAQRLGFTGRASVDYLKGLNTINGYYDRRVSTSALTLLGVEVDSLGASLTRKMGRDWTLAGRSSYSRGSSLSKTGTYGSEQFGIQVDRHFGQAISGYGSYSYRLQDSRATVTFPFLLTGNSNTIGMGLTYTPRSLRLKR
ncbi:MAG: hypothetical protein NVS9B15_01440 [Acidobacteriaceae bacterium]